MARGRALYVTGDNATHGLVGDKTLKPGPASLGQRRLSPPAFRYPSSYFRDNSAIPTPQFIWGAGRVTSMLN